MVPMFYFLPKRAVPCEGGMMVTYCILRHDNTHIGDDALGMKPRIPVRRHCRFHQ